MGLKFLDWFNNADKAAVVKIKADKPDKTPKAEKQARERAVKKGSK